MTTEAPPESTETDAATAASAPRAVLTPEQMLPDTRGKNFSLFVWKNKTVWFIAIVVFFILADQGSKMWAQSSLTTIREKTRTVQQDGEAVEMTERRFVPQGRQTVIPHILNFRYAENPAAAFSLTRSIPAQFRRPLLIIVSGFAMFFIGFWYFRQRRPDGILMTAFALIISGAVGNFIDRVRFGYVVDFIDAYAGFWNDKWPHWPTFNIADSCIVLGAFIVLYRTFRPLYPEEGAAEPVAVPEGTEA